MEVILKKECDHHPHSLDNPEPVVDFILRQQPEYEKYIHYNVRGSLQNSFRKFEKERRARVAFLGGSITEMDGWRNMIERQLQQRFPFERMSCCRRKEPGVVPVEPIPASTHSNFV